MFLAAAARQYTGITFEVRLPVLAGRRP